MLLTTFVTPGIRRTSFSASFFTCLVVFARHLAAQNHFAAGHLKFQIVEHSVPRQHRQIVLRLARNCRDIRIDRCSGIGCRGLHRPFRPIGASRKKQRHESYVNHSQYETSFSMSKLNRSISFHSFRCGHVPKRSLSTSASRTPIASFGPPSLLGWRMGIAYFDLRA